MLPGPEKQIATFILDISERRLAEQALQVSHAQLQRAEQVGQLGHWEWVVQEDQVNWSDGLYRLFNLSAEEFTPSYNAYLELVHPEDLLLVQNSIQAALQQPGPFEFESRILRSDGQIRYLFTRGEVLFAADGRPERMIGVALDTTDRVQAERAVHNIAQDLRRSNAELEQFAYVASHDLQEPLRMVTSFVQLLAHRYRGKLDEDADAYIGYAVDGAKRMQNLINDLLAYSRIGTRGSPFTQVSMEALLRDAQQDLQIAIEESHAQISHDPLPQVLGDPSQLSAVLQNLLSNAIKYRGADTPRIHVSVRRQGNKWVFSVRDNGIGIDPKFAERIFIIFQRLHAPGAYPGTGIGLAVCKRILQRHDGQIWVESFPGHGATFYFTLPIERSL
jgi:PAS domain S-box-containing protein